MTQPFEARRRPPARSRRFEGSLMPTRRDNPLVLRRPRFAGVAGRLAAAILAAAIGLSCVQAADKPTPVERVEVVQSFPHDSRAFCQGLAIDGGELFEGTGLYGESTLRKVDLESGKVLASTALHPEYFGEGIVVFGDEIFQLTWKNRVAIVYDKKTLKPLRSMRITGEGWGLTHDGKNLIVSDGSHVLKFLDPKTFETVRTVKVLDGRVPVKNLNELEYIDGTVWANVWYSDKIAKISPEDGRVVGWVDLAGLWPARERPNQDAVLNGIAFDADEKRIYVTGKNWPRLYEIRPVLKP